MPTAVRGGHKRWRGGAATALVVAAALVVAMTLVVGACRRAGEMGTVARRGVGAGVAAAGFGDSPAPIVMRSPDGGLRARLSVSAEGPTLSFDHDGAAVLAPSSLAWEIDGETFGSELEVRAVDSALVDETWAGIVAKTPTVRNHYREYRFALAHRRDPRSLALTIRLYDDGLAYRCAIVAGAGADSVTLGREATTLAFAGPYTAWAFAGEWPNVGPVDSRGGLPDSLMTPVVLRLAPERYVAIHEAAVYEHAPFSLEPRGPDGALGFRSPPATGVDTLTTSWRALIVGDHPGRLVESNLLPNLNPPNRIADAAEWVRPGKSMWDWRVAGYRAPDGFVYGLNTESHLRLIDFAADHNVQYLLIDANWYGHEFADDADPVSPTAGVDIERCMAHARARGVGVILYLNDLGARRFGLERVLAQFATWGAAGVKYGFMRGTEAEKVRRTRLVTELCARYRLMVDFHDGPVKPSGDDRTWPNLLTREYCHAQADGHRSYYPETMVSSAFVNMIAGPLDYTNGWFDLNTAHRRERVFDTIPGTVAAEVAKLVVAWSNWTVLPDAPEAYLAKPDLFAAIRAMPTRFDDLRVLAGEIDSHIVVARRSGRDVFVGALTNRDARTVTLPLDFLEPGVRYRAHRYADAPDTHYLTNKEAYAVTTEEVDAGGQLSLKLAPGGGQAIHFEALP